MPSATINAVLLSLHVVSADLLAGVTLNAAAELWAALDLNLKEMSDASRTPDWSATLAAYEAVDAGVGASVGAHPQVSNALLFAHVHILTRSPPHFGTASLQPTSAAFSQRLGAATAAYWRDPHFGDTFTRAAISGTGNFSSWDAASRRELLTKGSAYLVVRQNVLYRLFVGVDSCLAGASAAAAQDWQVAWALFAGSLEGTDGTGSGKSMYALGDKRCTQFRTCEGGASSTHPARNNVAAAAAWNRGLAALGAGDCFGALAEAEAAVSQATIPLLQGLLREAWEVDPGGVLPPSENPNPQHRHVSSLQSTAPDRYRGSSHTTSFARLLHATPSY